MSYTVFPSELTHTNPRKPGKIKAGSISNEIIAMMDWMPTLVAAAGDPDIKEKLLTGHTAGGKSFKVHLDGYNFLPYMAEAGELHDRSGDREVGAAVELGGDKK